MSWEEDAARKGDHLASIQVRAVNEPGALGKIAAVVGNSHGNITNLKLTERGLQTFLILIDIEVRDVRHLTDILAALRTLTVVETVERLRG